MGLGPLESVSSLFSAIFSVSDTIALVLGTAKQVQQSLQMWMLLFKCILSDTIALVLGTAKQVQQSLQMWMLLFKCGN